MANQRFSARRARKVGKVNGRNVYRIPVRVALNSSRLCRTVAAFDYFILAHTAADAANLMRDEWIHRPETEIRAKGPQGGTVERYVGWESCIAHRLFSSPRPQQFTIRLGDPV